MQYEKLLPFPPVSQWFTLPGSSLVASTIGMSTTCWLSTHWSRHARTELALVLPGSPGNSAGRTNGGLFGVHRLVASDPAELLPSQEIQPKLPGPFEPLVKA